MTDADSLFKALEPAVAEYVHGHIVYTDRHGVVAALSQAVSLKRIAAALEKLAAARPPTEGGPVPDSLDWHQRANHGGPPFAPLQGSGWNAWAGGKCPVPTDTRVEVRFRDGRESAGWAQNWMWAWWSNNADIVAWRLAGAPVGFPWQDWPGGELPPVPGNIRVEVKLRDGSGPWSGMPAFAWQWRHTDHPRDIIAWRLAK